jgi:hypothetical protein
LDQGGRLSSVAATFRRWRQDAHIAPLLRIQGFFNEFALDFETAAGERLPVIAKVVSAIRAYQRPLTGSQTSKN